MARAEIGEPTAAPVGGIGEPTEQGIQSGRIDGKFPVGGYVKATRSGVVGYVKATRSGVVGLC